MSVAVTLKLMLKIVETNTSALVSSSNASQTWSGGDIDLTLNSTSTPDAEDCAAMIIALVAGAKTIDLTSLAHEGGATKSANGKKIRAWLFFNLAANTGNIVVTKGASNGYSPVGTTFTYVVPPGGCALHYFDSDAGDVGASAKNVDVTGTGTESFYFKAIWG